MEPRRETSPLSASLPTDFEEIERLGEGAFGIVSLCRHKLDRFTYAVKKIRLKRTTETAKAKVLREIVAHAKLQHKHVVRYYQGWFETGYDFPDQSNDKKGEKCTRDDGKQEFTFLYIQLEYCPRTLREEIKSWASNNNFRSKEEKGVWCLFQQIVEGVEHLHSHRIIHSDLTLDNIFLDANRNIKIADFGLSLLLLEDEETTEIPENSSSGESFGEDGWGAYYYRAPEVHVREEISRKADMYAIGVIFFEMCHEFSTGSERHEVLTKIKFDGTLPQSFKEDFSEESKIVEGLISRFPSERPSASELLQLLNGKKCP